MQRLTLLAIAFCVLVCSAQTPQQNAQRTIETTLLDDLPTPEVAVPTAPVAFSGDGKRFLCYELLITNTEPIPARLQRVAVYADGAAVPLLLQEAKPLSTALLHPGVSDEIMAKRDRRVIRGGEQVVDLLWIELPVGSPIPRFLDHTLTLQRITTGKSLTLPVAHVSVAGAATMIQAPLRGSNWAAANGPSSTSQHRMAMSVLYGIPYFSQRYAIDWIQTDQNSKTLHGNPLDLHSYLCYGQPVYAVADAVVTWTKDGLPDGRPEVGKRPADPRVPITLETIAGNHVILDLGDGIYAGYAHLQPGSLRVKVGDHVKAGDVLGLVGDSGNSTEPHLHFQLMTENNILAAQGIPYILQQFTVRFGSRVSGDDVKVFPMSAPVLHKNEMPLENEIVDFPN
jgi:murein DD-endopeptidase MepM/ murein hydrolase activator NlpD